MVSPDQNHLLFAPSASYAPPPSRLPTALNNNKTPAPLLPNPANPSSPFLFTYSRKR